MQARLVKGSPFVHETFGAYKTVEELWDGELWADTESLHKLFGRHPKWFFCAYSITA